MSLVGLDLNASRARAVVGPAMQKLALVRLDGDQVELPLVLSLEDEPPTVGRAGLVLTRARPHQACVDFLPHLGSGRVWSAGALDVEADWALELTFGVLHRAMGKTVGVACALPAYFDEAQTVQFYRLAGQARFPLVGSLAAPVAAVLASPPPPAADHGMLLVIDADGHALTWSIVERGPTQVRLRVVQPASHLGRAQWLRRLVDGVAHRCVRHSRRDPRESAQTEQAVYEQVLLALDLLPTGARVAQLNIQGGGWFANLMLTGEELAGMVTPFLRAVAGELETMLSGVEAMGPLLGVVITHAAAGLPGLVAAVQARLQARPRPTPTPIDDDGDFGDQLLTAAGVDDVVHVLPQDALAAIAHEVAVRVHRGDFPQGHHDAITFAEGAASVSADAGPPRLAFRGREHVLRGTSFTLGRDPGCDLVFETELYPHVSAKHCEIIFDRRSYVICDKSRHGTLVNDRPVEQQAPLRSGDWIRLGPRGPVLRFLGQAGGPR